MTKEVIYEKGKRLKGADVGGNAYIRYACPLCKKYKRKLGRARPIPRGNGGSAADSQHLAAEFVGRFQKERQGLPAIALTVDTSILTAVGNDYGFDKVFARQVEALGNEGDVLIGISTSGTSKNVVAAVELAKAKGIYCVGMTAANGAKMVELCDECIAVPAKVTARAQEMHILIGHILCELVDGE